MKATSVRSRHIFCLQHTQCQLENAVIKSQQDISRSQMKGCSLGSSFLALSYEGTLEKRDILLAVQGQSSSYKF